MADLDTSPDTSPDNSPGTSTPAPPADSLAGLRLTVTTPWHPSVQRPFAGSFVQAGTRAVAARFARAELFHTEDWTTPAQPLAARLVRRDRARLADRVRERGGFAPRLSEDGYWVTDIPTPVTPGQGYADWALDHEAVLGEVLGGAGFDADIVHGHVGIYGGWLALRFAPRGARVVVTEHASFLGRILAQPRARGMYEQVLGRADAVICVSGLLRTRLAEAFPAHAEKIAVVPNVVDIESMPVRPVPVADLHRWIYVGKIAAAKGVPELLEAFATAARDEPKLSLTILGSGPLSGGLKDRAAQLGVAGRVEFLDPVEPQKVFGILHEHDLLVHPSKGETFGMTTVEAVGAGMPVLVTRCGGPQETLDGLDGLAGALIEVSDDPMVIVEGYRNLAARAGRLDLEYARAELVRRFGSASVAERLSDIYLGRTSAALAAAAPGEERR